MPKYIDADALKESFLIEGKDVYDDMYERWGASQELIEKVIDSAPTADVEPVRHGRWITLHGRGRSDNQCFVPKYFWCDQCKSTSESRRKYCPNCGAKMDKEEDSGNEL